MDVFAEGEGSMEDEMWNRVDIPFPSAVSCVRVRLSLVTDAHFKDLLSENENVLKLIRSEILQTEIRVLYELLYILNNSFKGNKTFKGLRRVEQCINRLKRMKLDAALQELKQLCPNKFQRQLNIKSGEWDVPSQPKLEWLCLKVLGAMQLISCTLNHCRRAFLLAKQHMKLDEFLILNVVITSLLSRFWVIFRGIVCCLSTLYYRLLTLLKEVAKAQPMPFLTDFSLPENVSLFLGPSDDFMQTKCHKPKAKIHEKKKKMISVAPVKRQKKNIDDLGVAVERGSVPDRQIKLKPSLKVERKENFKLRLTEATTVTAMETCLQEMIQWCKSAKMKKRKCLLTFLQLKCQRMKCLETAGYNIQRRIKTFRQEAFWALSLQGSMPTSLQSSAALKQNAHLRTSFHRLRSRLKFSRLRAGMKTKGKIRKWKRTKSPESGHSKDSGSSWASFELTPPSSHDDIDDIFASIGL